MAEDGEKSSVCTFSFKKRKGASLRRKQSHSSEDDETVVTRSEKKETHGVLSAKTVIIIFKFICNLLKN
jgi:hypothetical protein